jgi:membrane protease YdiL (CAAX protease family)
MLSPSAGQGWSWSGDSARAIGLIWPSRRGWLALLAVILINLAAASVFVILPPGEAADVPQADLSQQITGPLSVFLLLLGLLVRAALPEELLLRVTLQPRLAQFMSLGWAILLQALLFNFAHLPQQLFRDHQPLHLAVAYLLLIDNGLIAGYLWYRTRSLPLLVILHLFAYSRFGI